MLRAPACGRGRRLERVVHLWTLDERRTTTDRRAGPAHPRRAGQGGGRTRPGPVGAGHRRRRHPAGARTAPRPGRPAPTVLGPALVIPLEYPAVTHPAGRRRAGHRARPARSSPSCAARAPSTTVAICGTAGAGCAATRSIPPAGPTTTAAPGAPRPAGGVYLITGGLGGIGLGLAEQLARDCRARLVLLGAHAACRRAPSGAPAASAAPTSRRRRGDAAAGGAGPGAVALGAEVEIVVGDVADADGRPPGGRRGAGSASARCTASCTPRAYPASG